MLLNSSFHLDFLDYLPSSLFQNHSKNLYSPHKSFRWTGHLPKTIRSFLYEHFLGLFLTDIFLLTLFLLLKTGAEFPQLYIPRDIGQCLIFLYMHTCNTFTIPRPPQLEWKQFLLPYPLPSPSPALPLLPPPPEHQMILLHNLSHLLTIRFSKKHKRENKRNTPKTHWQDRRKPWAESLQRFSLPSNACVSSRFLGSLVFYFSQQKGIRSYKIHIQECQDNFKQVLLLIIIILLPRPQCSHSTCRDHRHSSHLQDSLPWNFLE